MATLAAVAGPAAGGLASSAHAAGPAAAQDPDTTTVQWLAPTSCRLVRVPEHAIQASLDPAYTLRVEVTVEEVELEAGFDAALDIWGAGGETHRTMHSGDCSTLLDAAILIALSAQAQAQAQSATSIPEPELPEPGVPQPEVPNAAVATTVVAPRAASEPEREVPLREPSAATNTSQRTWTPYVRVLGVVGWGLTPVIDLGGGGVVGVQWKRLRVEAGGEALRPSTFATGVEDAAGEVSSWSGRIDACVLAIVASPRISFPVCAGADVGRATGTGVGDALVSSTQFRATWAAVRAGPAIRVGLTPWLSLVTAVHARAMLQSPRFQVVGTDRAYRPKAVGVRAELGVEFHLPRPPKDQGPKRR